MHAVKSKILATKVFLNIACAVRLIYAHTCNTDLTGDLSDMN